MHQQALLGPKPTDVVTDNSAYGTSRTPTLFCGPKGIISSGDFVSGGV